MSEFLEFPVAANATRRWPQSGEVLHGKECISEVESHFRGFKLGVTRRHSCGDVIVVEWSAEYGDGRVYRNVTIGELKDGKAVRVTDYWGEPFAPPEWRHGLSELEDVRPHTPVEVYPGRIRYIDLEIDVVRRAGGRVAIIDHEELEHSFSSGRITGRLRDEAERLAREIQARAESEELQPVDPANLLEGGDSLNVGTDNYSSE